MNFAANLNRSNGLTAAKSRPAPAPYDIRKIPAHFSDFAGSVPVPFWVPPNLLKRLLNLKHGTVEPWNRVFSYVGARACVCLWFHSSLVPYSKLINKNNDLDGTENGTGRIGRVPLAKNELNKGCLFDG